MCKDFMKPATIGDAFRILDALIPEHDKAHFRRQSADDFTIDQHFGLGMWVRNTWIYGADKATYRALFGDELLHPDSASYEFLKEYHHHLKQQEQ